VGRQAGRLADMDVNWVNVTSSSPPLNASAVDGPGLGGMGAAGGAGAVLFLIIFGGWGMMVRAPATQPLFNTHADRSRAEGSKGPCQSLARKRVLFRASEKARERAIASHFCFSVEDVGEDL
jgi:hypothetical protein